MEQLLLVNPRKRRGRRKSASRTHRRSARRSNPRRRVYRRRSRSLHRANPVRRHRRRTRSHTSHRRRRRNPIALGGMVGGLTAPLFPALKGAGGALATDIAWNFIPLPATVKTGTIGLVAKGVFALALGMLLAKVVGRSTAKDMTTGALTVLIYGKARDVVGGMAPNLLGYYGAGFSLNDTEANPITSDSVGEYLSEIPNSLSGLGRGFNDTPSSLSEYLPEY